MSRKNGHTAKICGIEKVSKIAEGDPQSDLEIIQHDGRLKFSLKIVYK